MLFLNVISTLWLDAVLTLFPRHLPTGRLFTHAIIDLNPCSDYVNLSCLFGFDFSPEMQSGNCGHLELSEYVDSYGQWCVIPRMTDLLGGIFLIPFSYSLISQTAADNTACFLFCAKNHEQDMRTIVDAYPGVPLKMIFL